VSRAAEVGTNGARSPITIVSYETFHASNRANVEAQDGDVKIIASHDLAGEGQIQFDNSANVYSRSGDVTVQSGSNVLFVNGGASADGLLLVQSFEGQVFVGDRGNLTADTELEVEAKGDVEVYDGSTYVETFGAPISITSFEGAVKVYNFATVTSGDGDLSILGKTEVSVSESLVTTEGGSMTVTAFDGGVVLDDSNVRTDAGLLEVKAKGDVELRTDGSLYSQSAEVRIRSTEGSFLLDGDAELGRDVGDYGPIDVRTAGGISADAMGGSAFIHSSSVHLSCAGGLTLSLDHVRATTGGIEIESTGPVVIDCPLQAWSTLNIATTDDQIDLSGSTLTTSDRASLEGASGSILVESWAGAAGVITATNNAEITSGSSATQSGDVTLRIRESSGPPPVVAIEAFVLPKRVVVRLNEKNPEKSKLIAVGFCDLGPKPIDFSKLAGIDVGHVFATFEGLDPNRKGSKYLHKEDGLLFLIKPSRHGSSFAKFKLKITGNLDGKIDPGAPLDLGFGVDVMEGEGMVTLTNGKYALRRVRGTLIEPNLYLAKAKGRIKGPGKDSVKLLLGLATAGTTPAASDLTVRFGDYEATIPAADFTNKGDRYDYRGSGDGIARVVLDYKKEAIKIQVKGLDLGAYPEGASEVLVGVTLGADRRAVRVRMARKGSSFRY
jgi:hypothetical protein